MHLYLATFFGAGLSDEFRFLLVAAALPPAISIDESFRAAATAIRVEVLLTAEVDVDDDFFLPTATARAASAFRRWLS